MSLKRADETTRRGIRADLDQWRPRKRVESAHNGHKVSHAKGSSDKVPPEHAFSSARFFPSTKLSFYFLTWAVRAKSKNKLWVCFSRERFLFHASNPVVVFHGRWLTAPVRYSWFGIDGRCHFQSSTLAQSTFAFWSARVSHFLLFNDFTHIDHMTSNPYKEK